MKVSNNGQVRNRKRGNILKPHEDKDGYFRSMPML